MNERQRVAFVTGGSRGIGLACAVALRDQGHLTAVGSRSKPDDLPNGIAWYECDITDDESIDAALAGVEDDLGPVQILVANAGITRDLLALRMKTDDFASVVDANLTGTFRVTKRCLRGMMKARWGRIVFMSSVVGSLGQAGQANYAASKAGLAGLGRSLAREFASRGITVNLVAPGPIDTDMLAALSDETVAEMADSVPVGRVGTAEEVAAAVVYLTSEAAAYTTGATIPVDGGIGMGA
ncbi:MAG: 3-oxoacyl-ACP reductase FabG [Acidimicrobiales bacterium]